MSIINTNVMSLNSQRNLATNNASLGTTIQRLSSGLRINSAKDDAAGLAISERFTTQIRGMNQAARNANDGISLAQTAEGALAEIGNNLQRIRELSVQSRNATNSADDRKALDAEAQLLKAEIQRVSEQTTFNGTKLLDGNFMNQAFQVGADQGQIINIAQLADARIAQLGNWVSTATASSTNGVAAVGTGAVASVPATPATNAMGAFTDSVGGDGTSKLTATYTSSNGALSLEVTGAVTAASMAGAFTTAGFAADGTGTVNGFTLDLGASATISAAITAGTLTVQRADGANFTYAEAETGTAYGTSGGFNAAPAASTDGVAAVNGTPGTFGALTGGNLSINGVNIEVAASADAGKRADALVKAINTAAASNSAMAGVSASLVGGNVQLRGADGDITIATNLGTPSDLTLLTGLTAGTTSNYAAGTAQIGFATMSISTADGADNAIKAMDAALNAVNSARADLGAIQNRFQSVISNLNTTSENLSASRSRIRDTDFAKETAELTRTQILNQAGTAMLAQANQVPQSVLSLLR